MEKRFSQYAVIPESETGEWFTFDWYPTLAKATKAAKADMDGSQYARITVYGYDPVAHEVASGYDAFFTIDAPVAKPAPAGTRQYREKRPYQVWLETVSMDTVIESTDFTERLGLTSQQAWERWADAYEGTGYSAQRGWNRMDRRERAALLATFKAVDAEWNAAVAS